MAGQTMAPPPRFCNLTSFFPDQAPIVGGVERQGAAESPVVSLSNTAPMLAHFARDLEALVTLQARVLGVMRCSSRAMESVGSCAAGTPRLRSRLDCFRRKFNRLRRSLVRLRRSFRGPVGPVITNLILFRVPMGGCEDSLLIRNGKPFKEQKLRS